MQDLSEENCGAISVSIHEDPYDAARGTHALVICTEWDQFLVKPHINFLLICPS